MSDIKISQLNELTTPDTDDYLAIVDRQVSPIETKRITVGNFVTGGVVAPADVQYLVLVADAGLTVERVLTPGSGIAGTDGGAGSAYTLNLGVLTANWDAGGYEIRALKFQSDQATGTAPLIVASTTVVANLHAATVDQWHTTRTIDMSGDVSSDAVNIDGSGNITITNTAVANDSHTHSAYVLHSLAGAANDFLVASGANTYVKKTLAETGAILEGDLDHGNLQGLDTGADHSYIDQDVTASANATFATLTLNNSGLHILDTNASHDLVFAVGSDLSADRTLTFTTGDAARTITLSGNPTLDDWFDQSVKAAATPAFGGATINGTLSVKSSNELRFYDNGNYVGFEAPALAADKIWVLPNADGNASDFLQTDGSGNLTWAAGGGGGGAPTDAQYVTLALDGDLSAERTLAGTANQITLTDGGANSTITLALPQDYDTGATPTLGGLIIADGGTVGQAAGPLLTFDDTNNFLEITGCDIGLGTATPAFKFDTGQTTDNMRFGRVEIGSWPASNTYAYFGNEALDHSAAGNYAMIQGTDGTVLLNTPTAKDIYFRVNNVSVMQMDERGLGFGGAATTAKLVINNATAGQRAITIINTATGLASALAIWQTNSTGGTAGMYFNQGGSGSWALYAEAGNAGAIPLHCKAHASQTAAVVTVGKGSFVGDMFTITAAARMGVNIVAPLGQGHIDQSSTTGAIPVMIFDQADIDIEFIKFIGSSEDSQADRSLVDVADMTTSGALVGWFQIYVEDIQGTNPITDGVYYVPFYAAPSA